MMTKNKQERGGKYPMPESMKKAGREMADKSIDLFYDETIGLKVYMFYCKIMENLWKFYHKWILHKGDYGLGVWLTCRHSNPWVRAYNRIKDAKKEWYS